MLVPPLGALWESATVQVELEPDGRLIGLHTNEEIVTETAGGTTVTVALADLLFREAVTVTV